MTKKVRFSPLLVRGVFAGSLLLAGASRAGAVDVPFVTQPPIATTADAPHAVFAADLDRDGDLDVLVASFSDNTVAWYENTAGNGSAWTVHVITTAAAGASAVFAADIDGDGDTDVLSAAYTDGKVAWYENTAGNGSAWTARTIAADGSGTRRSVFAADVDGDGDMDALSASYSGTSVTWYENASGNGTIWTPHTITTVGSNHRSVAAADVDGDGDVDVLVTTNGGPTVAWHENTAGNGTAWSLHTITDTAQGPSSVVAADVDGDGDMDTISASFLDDKIAWYENTAGNGSAWTIHTVTTAADGARSAFAADVDGDGDADLLSASLYDDKAAWYENTGNGSTWTTHTLTTGADGAHAIFAADLDGDGDVDALSASITDDRVVWYRNETIHSSACFQIPPPISTTALNPRAVGAADLDGDGDVDALSGSGASILWYENASGDGTVWTSHTLGAARGTATVLTPADIDGDGDLDVLVGDAGFIASVSWFENTAGNGSAWTAHTISTAPVSSAPTAGVVADLDGDGDLDALVQFPCALFLEGCQGIDQTVWYENTSGNGSAWAAHTVATAQVGIFSAAAGDIDGDGDLDLVIVKFFVFPSIMATWYENAAGDGSTWTPHDIVPSPFGNGGRSISTADLDGDGDLDVVFAVQFDGILHWHENTVGDGTAWAPHTIPAVNSPDTAVVADLDGDGDLDAVSSSGRYGPSGIYWHENVTGDASLWLAHTIVGGSPGEDWTLVYSLSVADVDGDGDHDTVAASFYDDGVDWFDNRSGQFSLAATDTAPPTATNSELVSMLRIDASHLGRAGDRALELASLGFLFEEAAGDPLSSAEANALVESLRIYRDANGNGVFEPATDVLVTSLPTLVLNAGVQSIVLPDGDPNVAVAFGAPKTYFVVVELTANASQQSPGQFRVTHLGLGPSASTAEDRDYDIPLRAACPADLASSILMPVVPVELQGFTVE